jgi:hypothetical protein
MFERVQEILNDEKLIENQKKLAEWNVALEFPENITTEGRSVLHDIAGALQLSHHSVGKKGKSRRTIVYPKSVYKEKQMSEITRMHKERSKIRDTLSKKWEFASEPPSKRANFMEKVILELWYDKNEKEPTTPEIRNFIPKEEEVGKLLPVKEMLELILGKKGHL